MPPKASRSTRTETSDDAPRLTRSSSSRRGDKQTAAGEEQGLKETKTTRRGRPPRAGPSRAAETQGATSRSRSTAGRKQTKAYITPPTSKSQPDERPQSPEENDEQDSDPPAPTRLHRRVEVSIPLRKRQLPQANGLDDSAEKDPSETSSVTQPRAHRPVEVALPMLNRGRQVRQQQEQEDLAESTREPSLAEPAAPAPRKRGRPPKAKPDTRDLDEDMPGQPTSELDEEITVSPVIPTPRKRGRPRKVRPEQDTIQTDAEVEDPTPRKRGRPAKPRVEPEPEVQEDAEDNAAPRKRGRPRKIRPEPQQEDTLGEPASEPPRKRGRPPKARIEVQEPIEKTSAPRKRGRPPRAQVEVQEEETHDEPSAETSLTQKRGRPAKVRDDVESVARQESDGEVPVQRKRGRPSKTKVDEEVDDDDEEVQTKVSAPRKRGRPSKASVEEQEDVEASDENEPAPQLSPTQQERSSNTGIADTHVEDVGPDESSPPPRKRARLSEENEVQATPLPRRRGRPPKGMLAAKLKGKQKAPPSPIPPPDDEPSPGQLAFHSPLPPSSPIAFSPSSSRFAGRPMDEFWAHEDDIPNESAILKDDLDRTFHSVSNDPEEDEEASSPNDPFGFGRVERALKANRPVLRDLVLVEATPQRKEKHYPRTPSRPHMVTPIRPGMGTQTPVHVQRAREPSGSPSPVKLGSSTRRRLSGVDDESEAGTSEVLKVAASPIPSDTALEEELEEHDQDAEADEDEEEQEEEEEEEQEEDTPPPKARRSRKMNATRIEKEWESVLPRRRTRKRGDDDDSDDEQGAVRRKRRRGKGKAPMKDPEEDLDEVRLPS
ncbi:hypothetical protein CYLTODRAFT_189370 [Cylindrobasidium torrendii FP15055 ss-10]|uniref:Uncharacterized protein n=1 Tax=Cylindrobasidium torrendii FP15055 ss-10 TaxID=1314674 RepID=A0A0D7AVP4_9AGAR|nr:hypothetical protein CYLTODRAFT_189370 [Cylindrobasidium torrendii FP15055 ss-10]